MLLGGGSAQRPIVHLLSCNHPENHAPPGGGGGGAMSAEQKKQIPTAIRHLRCGT